MFSCNYCGGRYFDCKGKYPPKTKCKLIDAELHFEGPDGVWRTPEGKVAMRYRLATKRTGDPDDMRVAYINDNPPYWEVSAEDGRWWSVAFNPDTQTHLITNAKGRVVGNTGPTGRKLLAVVESHRASDPPLHLLTINTRKPEKYLLIDRETGNHWEWSDDGWVRAKDSND